MLQRQFRLVQSDKVLAFDLGDDEMKFRVACQLSDPLSLGVATYLLHCLLPLHHSFAKIVQTSETTKKNHFLFVSECSLIPNIRKTREIIGNKSNHITLIYSVL